MSLPDPRHYDPGYQIDILYTDENGVQQRIRAFANTINWIRVDGSGVIVSPPDTEDAPLNIVPPGITGEPIVDGTLTAFVGVWFADPDPSFTYQWLANDAEIVGATAPTYLLTIAEFGKAIKVRVRAVNTAGAAVATSIATVLITSDEPPIAPANAGLPAISGTPVVGETLTASTGSWTGTVPITYTFQWKADDVEIGGATAATYLVTSGEIGAEITCTVTATNIIGAASATSDPTAAVVDTGEEVGLPVNQVAPSLSGTEQMGNSLTVNHGTWTESPSFSRQWYADGFAIGGATGISYALTESDRSKRISCVVTATNAAGSAEASSQSSAMIASSSAVTKRYIRRVSAGTGNGTSWANAGTIGNLNAYLTAVGDNGEILIRADEGSYTASLVSISAIPTATGRVLVRGCDVDELPQNAVFLGTRTDPYISNGTNTLGPEVFRLLQGFRNVTFRGIEFRRCGNGCFRIGGDITGLVIEQCVADNVQRFIENTISGTAITASLSNSRIGHCTAHGYSRAFARLRYAGANNVIHDCFGDSEEQDGDNFAAGIVFSDTFNTTVIERCTMRNHLDTAGGNQADYWQGDGYSQENGNFANQFIDCIAKGNSDAGFDLKGNATLIRCIAEENKKNYRIWGNATMTDCISRDCYLRGGNSEASLVSLHSVDANLTINRISMVDRRAETTCFRLDEQTAIMTMNSGTLQRDPASTLVLNPNAATFDIDTMGAPPTNVSTPVLSGTASAEQTMACTTGSWSGTNNAFTYQWCRDDLYIDDATSNTYVLTSADIGAVITCRVFATNDGAVGEAVSNQSAVVTAASPVNTVAPFITGVQSVGATLGVNTGTWTGAPPPTFTYQWKNNGDDIDGAISSTYTLQAGDSGDIITVVVTGTNTAGSASATSTATGAIAASVATLFVAPTAAGLRNGSSFANAIALTSLPSALAAMGADGVVNLLADAGSYTITSALNINKGGTSGHPLIIRGVDSSLAPMKARIVGSRTNWTLPANPETSTSVSSWTTGNDIFNMLTGSDHILFRHIYFQNVARCFDCNSVPLDDITCEDIEFYNAQEGFYTNASTITNVTLRRWKGTGYSKRAIRCFADSHDWLIEDVEFNSGRQDRDDFAGAIILNDTAHDIVARGFIEGGIYSGILENHHDSSGSYWNGDSLGTERGNHDVLFENFICRGNTDGGVDSKGTNVTFRNVTCVDNKKNFRMWGATGMVMENCTSTDPFKRGGSSSTAHVHIIAGENDPVTDALSPDMTVKECTFNGGGAAWSMIAPNTFNAILREIGNTFNSASNNALTFNSRKLHGEVGDVTAPVIGTLTAYDTFNRKQFSQTLTADKDVSWAIVGGADQAVFDIVDSTGHVCKSGTILRMDKKSWTGVDDAFSVEIQAKDANGNTANKTVTVTVLEAFPPSTFLCNFEGPNDSTTSLVDESGGKTISFSSGAKLTTTTPLAGTSSLLLTGGTQRCNISDHDDFYFATGPMTMKALIRPTALPALGAVGGIMSQVNSSTDQRSFRFSITNLGALDFFWSNNGDNTSNVRSATGLIAINTTYEVMVDRDETGKFRLYIDGVMVASVASTQAIFNSNATVFIGNSGQTAAEGFQGRIDAVEVWKGFALCGDDAGYTP
jgi:hypothetical protein